MESPLSLDEETFDDNLEQDTVFDNENNGEMLLNDKHLSNGSNISSHKREEIKQPVGESKQKKNGKYLYIFESCEGHLSFLLILLYQIF